MADVKKVISIQVDTDTGEVEKLNQEIKQVDKNTKNAGKGTSRLAGAWKKVGTAIKAAGIGLLVAALAKVTQFLQRNQEVADGFTTAMNGLSMMFKDFFTFIGDNIGTVTQYFRELFDNPLEKIQEIGNAIQNYLMKQVKTAIEGFSLLGEAIGYLLDGEFAKAAETAGDGILKIGEAVVKINPATAVMANLAETIYDNRDAIVDYAKGTFEAASALTELNKNAELAEVRQQGLIEKYDREAELLRQVRDETNNTFAERIAANEELGRVLDKQAEEERELIKLRQSALEENFRAGLIAEQEYLVQRQVLANEEAEIEARITGFKSEQLINRTALANEQLEAERAIIEERRKLEREAAAEAMRLERERQDSLKQALANVRAQEEQEAAARVALEQQVTDQSVALIGQVASFADSTTKQGFALQKAAAIAEATINTGRAIVKALSETTDFTPTQSLRIANAAIIGVAGALQVANIARTQFGGGGAAGAGSVARSGGGGGQGAPAVNFNTVGASGINQLNESIIAQNNDPVRAYVVSSEVSSAQSLDRNRQSNATIG